MTVKVKFLFATPNLSNPYTKTLKSVHHPQALRKAYHQILTHLRKHKQKYKGFKTATPHVSFTKISIQT